MSAGEYDRFLNKKVFIQLTIIFNVNNHNFIYLTRPFLKFYLLPKKKTTQKEKKRKTTLERQNK